MDFITTKTYGRAHRFIGCILDMMKVYIPVVLLHVEDHRKGWFRMPRSLYTVVRVCAQNWSPLSDSKVEGQLQRGIQ